LRPNEEKVRSTTQNDRRIRKRKHGSHGFGGREKPAKQVGEMKMMIGF